ncbi:unnamed protein product [Heterobilharzia americana]|nr:unnamed protein product [Heterobilharzia americana]
MHTVPISHYEIFLIQFSVYVTLPIENQLNVLVRNYHSVHSSEADSIILATLMPLLSCCGLYGGVDFNSSSRFSQSEVYQDMSYAVVWSGNLESLPMRMA